MSDYVRPVNSPLDMNQWTYTYEVVAPETVQLSDSTIYYAGTYTYLVDLLDLTYQFKLEPSENAFDPGNAEFSGQAITTTVDPLNLR